MAKRTSGHDYYAMELGFLEVLPSIKLPIFADDRPVINQLLKANYL